MPPRPVPLLVAALLAVGLAVPAVPATAHAAADPDRTRLSAVLTLTGRAGDRARLHGLAARRPSPARLRDLAPAVTHRDAALRFATGHGLEVVRADAWTVTVSGPAAAIAADFGTSVHTSAAGTWAPGPAVPASLAGDVSSLVGLDTRPLHHPHATLNGTDNPQTSASIRSAYDLPAAWRGAGVTVGVLNLAGWNPGDLTTFARHEGIPLAAGQVTEVSVGADPRALDGAGSEFEVAMDAEAVLAAAPEARQRLYFAPNTSAGVVSAFQAMAADAEAGLLQVVTTSWGICEKAFDTSEPAATREAYAVAIDRLVAAGATLFAASGDAGAFDCSYADVPDNEAVVDFPASYVNTVGVGGTTLTPGHPEVAWHDQGFDNYLGDGSGGGQSVEQPLPGYQAGLVAGATHRLVPDVAADGDPQSGLKVYVRSQGGWGVGGGTSLSSPLWAGMLASALSSQVRSTGLGNILPALYAGAADPGGGLVDITAGHNGLFNAGAGYDQVTGLGVPRWSALGPRLLAATPVVPTSGTASRASRPPRSGEPRLPAGVLYVRTRTVPLTVTVPGGSSYQGFSAGETVPGCARLEAAPPSSAQLDPDPWQGSHDLLLTAFDSAQVCHVAHAVVVYDTVRPTTTVSATVPAGGTNVRVALGGKDATSGIGIYEVSILDAGGRTVFHTATRATAVVTSLTAGRGYRVQATARDRAGNVGPTVHVGVTMPYTAGAFSPSGTWARVDGFGGSTGSRLASRSRGATARLSAVTRGIEVILLRGPHSGYVDVVVDGRRTGRWDLYATTTSVLRRRVASWPRRGRHTVELTVVGGHRRGSKASFVVIEGVTVLR